jgi:hypothetical protein
MRNTLLALLIVSSCKVDMTNLEKDGASCIADEECRSGHCEPATGGCGPPAGNVLCVIGL